ncbi:MAG: hypothetical protein ACLULH_10785 [Bacteroides fragilis]
MPATGLSPITFHDSLKSRNNGNPQYALPRAIDFLRKKKDTSLGIL